jgi:hypothetical protein
MILPGPYSKLRVDEFPVHNNFLPIVHYQRNLIGHLTYQVVSGMIPPLRVNSLPRFAELIESKRDSFGVSPAEKKRCKFHLECFVHLPIMIR